MRSQGGTVLMVLFHAITCKRDNQKHNGNARINRDYYTASCVLPPVNFTSEATIFFQALWFEKKYSSQVKLSGGKSPHKLAV